MSSAQSTAAPLPLRAAGLSSGEIHYPSDNDFWMSRDLAIALGYSDYRNFRNVGRKAYEACKNSGFNPNDHFVLFNDMVSLSSGAERQVNNVKMSRYACYLAVHNADPSKPIVAQA